jgi:hypothetical protein
MENDETKTYNGIYLEINNIFIYVGMRARSHPATFLLEFNDLRLEDALYTKNRRMRWGRPTISKGS